MGPTPILKMAVSYGLHPRLWLLLKLVVTKGAPLPFAFDILTPARQYGNRAFTQYPVDIHDYFKQTFPEGYSWERSMIFEDQAVCTATSHVR